MKCPFTIKLIGFIAMMLLLPCLGLANKPIHWFLYTDWDKQCPVQVDNKTDAAFELDDGNLFNKQEGQLLSYIMYALPTDKGGQIKVSIKSSGKYKYDFTGCKTTINFPIKEDNEIYKGYYLAIRFDEKVNKCVCEDLNLPEHEFFISGVE